MQCDICLRTGGHKLPFLCPTDARNQLYEHRIQHAQVLLEKDALDQEVSALLKSRPNGGEENDNEARLSRPHVNRLIAEKEQAEDRTSQIIAHADELRANMEKARAEIAKRKAAMARKKLEMQKATEGLEARRARQTDEVEKAARMTKYKWNQTHAITASSRAFLCGEAAKLCGLRRVRRNNGSEEYKIGGVSIVDLRAMNTASPAQISTSLSLVVRLLMLSTHYLAIRLPAEITIPHGDYPLPTIFPLLSSYKHENVPFPGTTTLAQPTDDPTAAAASPEQQHPKQPRPRPLFLRQPLPMLAAEDAASHALFLEGVTLLAYNIAWLCKTQGVPVGDSASFEDICNIGQNMFNLLIVAQARKKTPPPSSRARTGTPARGGATTAARGAEEGDKNTDRDRDNRDKDRIPGSHVGHYSHGTAHSFLGSSAGVEFTRNLKVLSPTKLVDKLKVLLANEVANADWELLNPDAWAMEEDMQHQQLGDEGIMVAGEGEGDDGHGHGHGHGHDDGNNNNNENGGGNWYDNAARKYSYGYGYGMHSFMVVKTGVQSVMDAAVDGIGAGERKPGTSGWTKVKPRDRA